MVDERSAEVVVAQQTGTDHRSVLEVLVGEQLCARICRSVYLGVQGCSLLLQASKRTHLAVVLCELLEEGTLPNRRLDDVSDPRATHGRVLHSGFYDALISVARRKPESMKRPLGPFPGL